MMKGKYSMASHMVNYKSIINKQEINKLVKIVPKHIIQKHRVVPIRLNGKKVTVAMDNPLNVIALDDLYLINDYEFEIKIVSKEEIDDLIDLFLGISEIDDATLSKILEIKEESNYYKGNFDNLDINDAPVIKVVNSIIHKGVKMKASDIHIEPTEDKVIIRFRIDGMLIEITSFPKKIHSLIVSRIKLIGRMDIAEKRLPQDGRANFALNENNIDLRISTLPSLFGEKVVIRILDNSSLIINLEELGMNENLLGIYKKLIKKPHGMILITGPAGSGKTTTLYATLNFLKNPFQNIVSIEDPVEYILPGIVQTELINKIGLNFARGLKAVLRQDPDIIMVGEIRDAETAKVAVQAAISGHLVLSTLHTNNASGAIARLIEMDVKPFLVASAVIGVVAQRLVRKICEKCKEEYTVPPNGFEREILKIPQEKPLILYRGKGCSYCNNTGYSGRTALFEVLLVTKKIHELILQKKPTGDIFQNAVSEGMVTFTQDGVEKVLKGITTISELNRVSYSLIQDYTEK